MGVQQHRELHAAEVLVLRVAHLVVHVAVDGIREPRADQLDEIAGRRSCPLILYLPRKVKDTIVTHRPNCERPKSEAPTMLQLDRLRVGGRERRLQEPVRRDRELELPELVERHAVEIRARERHGHAVLHVPGVGAADDGRDALLGHRHPAERREVALPPRVVLARPLGVEVDGARVVGDLELRPVALDGVLLADQRRRAGGRNLDGLQVLAAHRLERGQQGRTRVNLLSEGGPGRQPEQRHENR